MTIKKSKSKTIIVSDNREAPIQRQISNKDLAVMKVMAEKQIDILTSKTPDYAIKTRVGGGGKVLKYVSHGYVTDQLNKAFGFDWDYKLLPVFDNSIIKHVTVKTGTSKNGDDILTHYVSVYGELTVRIHNPQKPSEIIATITKPGPGSSVWFPSNEFGDAIKSAKSDGLKVAAHELGIALDLYWDDEAEFSKHEQKVKSESEEFIDAIEETNNSVPADGVKMFAQAQSRFNYDLPKIQSILGDGYKLKDYKIEDWDILEKYFEGEKK
jgi:hypothetical protein